MGIWFGAVESLGLPGANICEHILSVVIPTNNSPVFALYFNTP